MSRITVKVVARPRITVRYPGPQGPGGGAGGGASLGETSTTAYRGDRGKIAYDHSQTTGNPHGTTIANISGLQTALDNKQATDADLTTIAGIDSTVAGALVTDGTGWFRKTYAQFKTALGLTKSDVGLSNVDNTSDASKPISSATQTALDLKLDAALLGVAYGAAELDENGILLTSQLPSYVDDVVAAVNFAAFPATGEDSKIYVDKTTNLQYRWDGSAYAVISPSIALGETSSTAYRGDRGATAYTHSQLVSGNPHNVTKADLSLDQVDNTADADKPVSDDTQAALDLKQNISSALQLGSTGTTAHRGDHGTTAYTHSQLTSGNPHNVTKTDVGLSNADNTSDANKPVSTAQQTALDAKVAKSLFDANTILYATTDDTPAALTVGTSTFVGRKASGGIAAMTVSEVLTLLGLTTEDLQDLVGAMVNGGTETGITVTYDDTNGRLDFVVDDTTKVAKTLFDANTVLYATTDNTPVALTVGASTFVGRKATGDISAMSVSEVQTLITATNGKGYVNHGSTAGTARPSGFASIEWLGTVEPTNAVNGDTWINA